MLSLQNLYKTDRYLERPPKKTSRPRPETHLFRAGPGRRKRCVCVCVCVQLFLENGIHSGSASCKILISWVGPKVRTWPPARKRSTFSPTVFSTTLRVASADNKINCWLSCLNQKLFRTFDKTACFVQARAKITLREKQCAPFPRNSTM